MAEQTLGEVRNTGFIHHLYEEKLKHKEHRHEFLKQKLTFTLSLFTLSFLNTSIKANDTNLSIDLSLLLFFVPLVALAFDMYIFSEDFKVKRIGVFSRKKCHNECDMQYQWEEWLCEPVHREHLASWVSQSISWLITFLSWFILLLLKDKISLLEGIGFLRHNYYLIVSAWFILILVLIYFMFVISRRRRNQMLSEHGTDV
ncbi:hypothetical protein JW998_14085 [candidate division KSB1 bacterium]|nr:hypothetical protein [candidate division KSB1 bacterium]